jgi:hypothetical protein
VYLRDGQGTDEAKERSLSRWDEMMGWDEGWAEASRRWHALKGAGAGGGSARAEGSRTEQARADDYDPRHSEYSQEA